MRVDFYVLGQVPPEKIVPALAARALGAGERLLVVSDSAPQREALSDALWSHDGFLAHGDKRADRQPILIAATTESANGAKLLCLADGEWREDAGFERIFYLFGEDRREAARLVWRDVAARDGVEAFFWKQEGGKWLQGP